MRAPKSLSKPFILFGKLKMTRKPKSRALIHRGSREICEKYEPLDQKSLFQTVFLSLPNSLFIKHLFHVDRFHTDLFHTDVLAKHGLRLINQGQA